MLLPSSGNFRVTCLVFGAHLSGDRMSRLAAARCRREIAALQQDAYYNLNAQATTKIQDALAQCVRAIWANYR
jgi:hypothetical protein